MGSGVQQVFCRLLSSVSTPKRFLLSRSPDFRLSPADLMDTNERLMTECKVEVETLPRRGCVGLAEDSEDYGLCRVLSEQAKPFGAAG